MNSLHVHVKNGGDDLLRLSLLLKTNSGYEQRLNENVADLILGRYV
jgi:hypothetical protein